MQDTHPLINNVCGGYRQTTNSSDSFPPFYRLCNTKTANITVGGGQRAISPNSNETIHPTLNE